MLDVVIPDPRNCRRTTRHCAPLDRRVSSERRRGPATHGPGRPAGTGPTSSGTPGRKRSSSPAAATAPFSLENRARCGSGRFPVEFVDGTGSGDAFAAGYIAGLLDGCSPERCLEIGQCPGSQLRSPHRSHDGRLYAFRARRVSGDASFADNLRTVALSAELSGVSAKAASMVGDDSSEVELASCDASPGAGGRLQLDSAECRQTSHQQVGDFLQ